MDKLSARLIEVQQYYPTRRTSQEGKIVSAAGIEQILFGPSGKMRDWHPSSAVTWNATVLRARSGQLPLYLQFRPGRPESEQCGSDCLLDCSQACFSEEEC
eukprot:7210427-Pyramimonas_sp.AAC.1